MVQEDQLLTNSVLSDTTGSRKQKHNNFQHHHLQEDKSITFYSFKTPILKDFENHFS